MVAIVRTGKTGVNVGMTLDQNEWKLIAAALAAVSPSGGGSDTFHLGTRIECYCRDAGAPLSLDTDEGLHLVGTMQTTAYEEYRECVEAAEL